MGNTCKPMAVSFQCMTKFTTNKKIKKLKKKKQLPGLLISSGLHFFMSLLLICLSLQGSQLRTWKIFLLPYNELPGQDRVSGFHS